MGLENEAADADDAGRTLGWQLLLMMLVGLCNHKLCRRQGQLRLMMLAAWGWRSPGVAADADDAGRVGLEKPWGGSCCFMMLVIFCCPRQRHLMVMMVAVWDLGCSWC